jgi:hypothetical protein
VGVPKCATAAVAAGHLRSSLPWGYQSAQPPPSRPATCAVRYRGGTKVRSRRRHGRPPARFATVGVPKCAAVAGTAGHLRGSLPWGYQSAQPPPARPPTCAVRYRGGTKVRSRRRPGRPRAQFATVGGTKVRSRRRPRPPAQFATVAVPKCAAVTGPAAHLRGSRPWGYQSAQPPPVRPPTCAVRYRGGTKVRNRRRHGRPTARFATVEVPSRPGQPPAPEPASSTSENGEPRLAAVVILLP